MRLVVFTVLLAACSDGESEQALKTNRSFTQLVNGPSTRAECEQSGQYFNCLHWIDLCENGAFVLVVTDIINEGRYILDEDRVTATVHGGGDAPPTFELTLDDVGFMSPQLTGQHPWIERALTTDEQASLASSCESITSRTWWNE